MSRIHARCEGLLSILKPNRQVFNFSKYGQAFANAIISVVQTGVKSPGCEKNTNHFPL